MRIPFVVAAFTTVVAAATNVQQPPAMPPMAAADELGISPESLIVCGFTDASAANVQSILCGLGGAESLRADLTAVREAVEETAEACREMSHALLVEPENQSLLSQFGTLMSDLAAHEAALASARDALLDVVLDGFPVEDVALLKSWQEHSDFVVPASFRAVLRSHEEWCDIHRALRAEARAARTGATLGQSYSDLLAAVRADPAVAEAETQLLMLSSQVESMFAEYFCE